MSAVKIITIDRVTRETKIAKMKTDVRNTIFFNPNLKNLKQSKKGYFNQYGIDISVMFINAER